MPFGLEKKEKSLSLTLGGFPIPEQTVQWRFSAGANPGTMTLTLPRTTHDAIIKTGLKVGKDGAYPLFTDLHIKTTELGRKKNKEIDIHFTRLVLLDADQSASPYEATWTLADRRWLLGGLTCTGSFNITRGTNDRGVVGQEAKRDPGDRPSLPAAGAGHPESSNAGSVGGGTGGGGAGPTPQVTVKGVKGAPVAQNALAREGLARFGKKNFLEWTIQPGGTPYTALDLAIVLLLRASVYVPKQAGEVILDMWSALKTHRLTSGTNGYMKANVNWRAEDLVGTLETWLRYAEVALGVKPDGSFYAYSILGEDVGKETEVDSLLKLISPFPAPTGGGGFLTQTNRTRTRAASVDVIFPQEHEKRFGLADTWLSTYGRDNYNCQNVIQLPDDVKYKGQWYRKGTYVERDLCLTMWREDQTPGASLPLAGNPWSKAPLNAERIRKMWFPSNKLSVAYGWVLQGGSFKGSAIWAPRVAAIQNSYRQLWRINPKLNDFILSWKPYRVAIADPVSQTYIPSYAAVDHCVIPRVTIPEFKRRTGKAGTNIDANDAVPNNASASIVQIQMVDQGLGIFRLQFNTRMTGEAAHVGNIIPSKVTNLPTIHAAGLLGNSGLWSQAELSAEYSGSVILTCQMGTDPKRPWMNEKSQTYRSNVTAATVGWKGGVNTLLKHEIADRDITVRWSVGNKSTPANFQQVSAMALSRARQYYFSMRDRLQGKFTVPGWSSAYRLFGSVGGIILMVDPSGTVTTTFDLSREPQGRLPYHYLPGKIRQAIYGELPRDRSERG